MFVRTLVAASLLALTTASAAAAQARSTTQGFHLGLALNGSSIQITDDQAEGDIEAESGSGINLTAGYGFTPQFGILLSVAGARMDDAGYGLGQADIAGRFSFANPSRAFVPYLEFGFAGLSLQDDLEGEDLEFQGTGFTGAAGLKYFFSPKLALDLNLRYTAGEFDTFKLGGESVSNDDGVEVSTARFNIGVSWFPGGGR